jgi:hypothetical protein
MTETEQRLIAALAAEARGPRRNGIFAIWLFARVAESIVPPDPLRIRAHRKRVALLQRRMTTLSIPPPLRRGLASAVRLVADGTPRAAAMALQQLVAPVRDTLGGPIAEVIATAANRARRATSGMESA